jgi:exodeoxyribonuclease VII large subunit
VELHVDQEPTVVRVGELVVQLRDALREDFSGLWIEGEISSLHRSRPGHVYFDLVDEEGQLRCALFRRSAERVRFDLEDGQRVRVRASVDVYPERGSLQLIVDEVRPAGEGALRLAFEKLRQRLIDEGLFDEAHKQELPFMPARVGLVTSVGGAAIHDFARALRRRGAGLELVVCDARVQGENAWREIVRGLHLLDAQPGIEVIVLARGGGSIEDLWAFNREELVRAIFEVGTPVISAVGHEVDVVLSDLVADARASTPTAAAELVAPDRAQLEARLRGLEQGLARRQRARLEGLRQQLVALERGLADPAQRLAELGRRLAAAHEGLRRAVRGTVQDVAARVARAGERLVPELRRRLERGGARLGLLGGRLDALSPLAVLGRGYGIVLRDRDGVILRSSGQVDTGDDIRVRLAEGGLAARVTGKLGS